MPEILITVFDRNDAFFANGMSGWLSGFAGRLLKKQKLAMVGAVLYPVGKTEIFVCQSIRRRSNAVLA